jgi:lysophospholipase L1-like esterase
MNTLFTGFSLLCRPRAAVLVAARTALVGAALACVVASGAVGQPAGINNHEPSRLDERPKLRENPAVVPVPRAGEKDKWWMDRQASFNERVKQGAEKGDIGMLFIGDSITQGWEGEGKGVWAEFYAKRNAVNLGIGGDRTQHVIWRLRNGNLAGLAKPKAGAAPKVAVVMIGTNNSNGSDNSAEEIAEGVQTIIAELRTGVPETKVLLLGIFPRGEKPNPQREKLAAVNERIAKLDDGKNVFYMDIGKVFLAEDGTLPKDIMPDFLHLSAKGYRLWAEAIEAKVKDLLGEE